MSINSSRRTYAGLGWRIFAHPAPKRWIGMTGDVRPRSRCGRRRRRHTHGVLLQLRQLPPLLNAAAAMPRRFMSNSAPLPARERTANALLKLINATQRQQDGSDKPPHPPHRLLKKCTTFAFYSLCLCGFNFSRAFPPSIIMFKLQRCSYRLGPLGKTENIKKRRNWRSIFFHPTWIENTRNEKMGSLIQQREVSQEVYSFRYKKNRTTSGYETYTYIKTHKWVFFLCMYGLWWE